MKVTRIAVVDDDSMIRLGICSSVDWGQYGYEVVGEADNGQSGWEMIQREKPDIVLLDMAMPGMDGIEVLKKIQQSNLHTKAVILSCHDDFHYVKKAMKNGAYDYLRKSEINSGNVLSVLDEIRQSIQEELTGSQADGDGDWESNYSKYACLQRLITDQDEAAEHQALVERLNVKERNLCCVVFAVAHYQQVLERYDDYPYALEHGVVNLAKQIILQTTQEVEVFTLQENRYVLLLSGNEYDGEEGEKELFTLLDQVWVVLNNYLNVEMIFGAGPIVQAFSELPETFERALYSQKLHYFQPERKIIKEGLAPADTLRDPAFSALTESAKSMIPQNNYPQVFARLQEVLKWLYGHTKENLDVDGIQGFFSEFIQLIMLQEGKIPEKPIRRLQNCESLQETEGFFLEFQKELQKDDTEQGQSHYLIRAATEYIQQNLSRGDISLGEIAEYLLISKSYLCRLFQKKLGISVQHYIHNIRIEKAKEYLNDFHLKIYEIAEMTGFNSSTHFNIVFKKIMNCTPVEYRNGLKH